MTYLVKKTVKGKIYYYEYESYREGGKVKHRCVGYLGKTGELKKARTTPPSIEDLIVHNSVDYGTVVALYTIAERIGLSNIIYDCTSKGGGQHIGKLIEIMVLNRCLEPVSRNRLRDWYEKTALPVFTGILPQKLQPQTFYNAMDYLTDPAILRIQKELFRNVQRIYGIDTSKVFYDLTSTYFEGTKCPMGEFGHSTEHRPDKKQVNIGLAVDRDGIPIVHEVFGGSTRDVTTVQGFAERLKIEFGIQAPIIVIDRGMVSRDNLDALLELGYDYIVARKMGPTEKRIVTGISDDEYVKGIVTDVLHKKEIWTRETEVDGKRLIVCWNKEKAIDDKTFRDAMITKTEEKLRKIEERCGKGSLKKKDEVYHKTYSILEKYDTKQFFDISINQRGSPRMSFVLRLSAIEKAQRLDGKFILETSDTSLTPIEVVRSYRDRDAVEKFFQTLKDIVELRPVYVYTEQHVKAHVFICVLAVLLLAIIRKVLKEANKDLTSIKALGILDGIKRVEFSIGNGKGIVVRTTEFNNQQREIISLLNVVPIGL